MEYEQMIEEHFPTFDTCTLYIMPRLRSRPGNDSHQNEAGGSRIAF